MTGLANIFEARAQIVHKLRRNPFACPGEFLRAK